MVLTGEICFGLEVGVVRPVESGGPQWDDPNGQLPGTGIPGDGGDSLYRSSSLRRRRDASPV